MAELLFTRVDRPVGKLLGDVIEGGAGLPDLQRPFVWKDRDVRNLLDSMLITDEPQSLKTSTRYR